jgi:hypothetical protein
MIDFFKQPPVFGAMIAVLGAAIIAPLVKKLYFDVQNRLRVEVRAWNYRPSEALKKFVSDAKLEYSNPMRKLLEAEGYLRVTITNTGKKKISGVTVATELLFGVVLQIDDADEIIEAKKGQITGVGDIQPKHSRVIHIWTIADVSEFNFSVLKSLLRISADELDSVRRRFPMPRYLRQKNELRLVWIFNFLVIAALFIALYSGFIHE